MKTTEFAPQGNALHVTNSQFTAFLNRLHDKQKICIDEPVIKLVGTDEALINLAKSPIKFKNDQFSIPDSKAGLPVIQVSPNGAQFYAKTMKRNCRVHAGVIHADEDRAVIGLDRLASYRDDELIIIEKATIRQLVGALYDGDDQLVLAGKLKSDWQLNAVYQTKVIHQVDINDQIHDRLELETTTDRNECAFSFRVERVAACIPIIVTPQPIATVAAPPMVPTLIPAPTLQPAPLLKPPTKPVSAAVQQETGCEIGAAEVTTALGAAACAFFALLIRSRF